MHRHIAAKPRTDVPISASADAVAAGMPSSVQDRAVGRLFAVTVALGGLALVGLILNLIGPSTFGWHTACARGGAITHGMLVLVSGGFLLLLRGGRLAPERLLNLGLYYEIFYCFAVSMTELARPREPGTLLGGLSFVCVLIILFPMFVPTTLRKSLITGLAAASTGPLAVLVRAQMVGEPVPPFATIVWSYLFNYITVALSIIPAVVIRSMGREVSRARRMGGYELEELLGRGGMGEVWRATHSLLRRPAAIKLILPESLGSPGSNGGSTVRRRFEREAQATAELHSPHTIQLYDFGATEDGSFYYVMELLDGFDLETLVKRFGPQPAERVAQLLRQACCSLWDAHQSSLIHRDIKPANIYVCRYGHKVDHVKILDFGLVKHEAGSLLEDAKLTQADTTTGTPAYLAPEMALGEREIDGRADIYSLGCVGYWLLTGQLTFERDTPMKTVLAHIQEPPEPPSQRTELEIPAALESVVMSCLEKDADKRPQTARELSEALAGCGVGDDWTEERALRWWGSNSPVDQNAP